MKRGTEGGREGSREGGREGGKEGFLRKVVIDSTVCWLLSRCLNS